jgi:hypothetical protein
MSPTESHHCLDGSIMQTAARDIRINFAHALLECQSVALFPNDDIAIMSLSAFIDASKTTFILSLVSITFAPMMWNVVARNGKFGVFSAPLSTDLLTSAKEYRNKTLTYMFCGNAYLGCYLLAMCIFTTSRLRDHMYVVRVVSQSRPLTHTHTLHTCTYIHTQLPSRDPRTAAYAPAPRPARHARSRRALRHRPDFRRDLELGTRYHGQVHGRLFRHPQGLPC